LIEKHRSTFSVGETMKSHSIVFSLLLRMFVLLPFRLASTRSEIRCRLLFDLFSMDTSNGIKLGQVSFDGLYISAARGS